jgi:hypothetical protein
MHTHSTKTDSKDNQNSSLKQVETKIGQPEPLQGVPASPGFLDSPQNILQLSHAIGNQAVMQLIKSQFQQPAGLPVQGTESEERLQLKRDNVMQRQETAGDENELQMKPNFGAIQCVEKPGMEMSDKSMPETSFNQTLNPFAPRPVINTPGLFHPLAQRKSDPVVVQCENKTGLPDNLKTGVESLSGLSVDGVRVHYNSAKPAEVGAFAYAQGTDIHVAPGQERHLPHEAWHVVQQMQRRVQPTSQAAGLPVNDEPGLEKEADVMGKKALQMTARNYKTNINQNAGFAYSNPTPSVTQGKTGEGGYDQYRPVNCSPCIGGDIIQLTKVKVNGGEFQDQDNTYLVTDGFTKGAEIVLHFTPDEAIGNLGDTISLVQTVRDTTKLTHGEDGQDITPLATTSLLHTRKLTSEDPGVTEDEVGVGIDQEVLSDDKEPSEKTVVNLDPRYSERRMNKSAELNIRGKSHHPDSVRTAIKKDNGWTKAVLNDAPGLNTRFKIGGKWVQHTLTGGMDFEVVALHNESGKYLGSVKWGWKMVGSEVKLNPSSLTLASAGEATETFLKAAEKWNKTKIKDPKTGIEYDPRQLPTSKDQE